jgi:hypothetical protein
MAGGGRRQCATSRGLGWLGGPSNNPFKSSTEDQMNPDYDKSNYLSDYFSFQCLNKKTTFVKTAPLEFFLMIGKFNSIYLRSCTELILFLRVCTELILVSRA